MGLRLKFNLVLVAVFAAGFVTIALVAGRYLDRAAFDDAQRAASVIVDTASFTNLDPRVATGLGSRLADMSVREFAQKDAQAGVEGEAAGRFQMGVNQVSEVFTAAGGEKRLVVARLFHAAGGNRVRMANVNLAPVMDNARVALTTLMSSIGTVFMAVFILLNLMLDRMIVRPVAEMARQADAVSIGDFSIPAFKPVSKDEIGVLGTAFNRMRRSTEEAIALLKGQ
ncbi:MAG: HAMP domain-containing protein [Betaproteobacteria bacterium]|nr:HAMP domain-containing protein [Betaproteobacteria bacterium]